MRDESSSPDPLLAHAIAALRDQHPMQDLWPAIVPRLRPRAPRGSIMLRWPVALAAGFAVAFASAAATYVVLHDGAPLQAVAGIVSERLSPPQPVAPAPSASLASAAADSALLGAIAELEELVTREAGALDPRVRTSITHSLATLDRAIADAEAARALDPESAWASRYLTATLQRKFGMLQTVVTRTGKTS